VWDAYQHGTLDGEPRKTEASGLTIGYEPRVTEEEVSWAATRIGQDGRLHENEMALINFLKSHNAHLHPKLVPILDRVAA
jgi:hypothetical protein